MENTYVQVFRYLFPGLLSVIILDSLIFREKQESYKYFFEAFIFTVISNYALKNIPSYCGFPWGKLIYWASIVVMPVLVALNHNRRCTEKIFLKSEITKKSNLVNTWNACFTEHNNCIRIKMKDEKEIVGTAEIASEDNTEGLIYLSNAAWVDEDNNETDINAAGILIHKSEIKYIYFLHSAKYYDQQEE